MIYTIVQIYKSFTRIISVVDPFFHSFHFYFYCLTSHLTAKIILESYMANNGMAWASTISKGEHIIVTLE